MVYGTPAVEIDRVRHSVKHTIKCFCIILTSYKRSVESQVACCKIRGYLCGIIMLMIYITNHRDQVNAILTVINILIPAIIFEPLRQILRKMLK